ncbi:MAG: hypothetical protein BGP06_17035 [Rhizobiales bacterium 65-9]|nr:dihydrodipicolinate synthase family protein [Hyphomicrobiales bacterium]OJY38136.1 MAG: hypothetical protein BGP06_17035 [Rhizobiales bacterium 65-9]
MSPSVSRFGISPALATPLATDGSAHVPSLVAHLSDLLSRGCSSGTIFGTTGEGPSFGLSERERVAKEMIAAGVPAAKLIEGVIACSHEEAVAGLSGAYARGAKAALLAPPFYFRGVPDDALFAWFDAVFRAVGPKLRDVILYHIPGMTGAPLSFDLIARLRKVYPGAILGVKDSSGDRDHTMRLIDAHGDLVILVGDERYLGAACAKGAQGSICGCGNFAPERMVRIVETATDDPMVKTLVDAIVAQPIIPAVKALTAHARGDASFAKARPPLPSLDAAATARLAAIFDSMRDARRAAE